jgi:hypothetical protein
MKIVTMEMYATGWRPVTPVLVCREYPLIVTMEMYATESRLAIR